jgi:hypothetical protein
MNLESTNHREQGIASIEANKHERSPQELSHEVLTQADKAIEQQSSELKNLVGEDLFNQDFVGELANAKAELENELAGIAENSSENNEEQRSPEELAGIMTFDSLSAKDFATVREAAMQNPEMKAAIIADWEKTVGPFAKKLFEDPAYSASIEKLWTEIKQPIHEGGPVTVESTTLQNVIAIHEIMGPNAATFAKACDLKTKTNVLDYDMYEGQGAISIKNMSIDAETGELFGETKLTLAYFDQTGEQCDINRIITKHKNEKGEAEKSVYHERFALPNSVQEGGVAGKVLKESLSEYDTMGIERIDLHANISVGGYAWASYGFEFNKAQHDEKSIENLAEHFSDKLEIILATMDFFEESFDDEKDDWVKKAKIPALEKPIMDILQQLKSGRTPQELAATGIDGPFFCRDKSDEWHMFENKAEAKNFSQKLKDTDQEHPDYKGTLHAGKLVMLGSDWFGSIDLTKKGPSQGKNRVLLEKALSSK